MAMKTGYQRLKPPARARPRGDRQLQVPHGPAETEHGEALVVDRVVEIALRLDPSGHGVEDLGIRAELLAVAVGDDIDVLLGLDDRQLGHGDALAGLLEVE